MGYHQILSNTPKDKTATSLEDKEAVSTSRRKRKREEKKVEEETPVVSQKSLEKTPASTKRKGKKLVFITEEKDL